MIKPMLRHEKQMADRHGFDWIIRIIANIDLMAEDRKEQVESKWYQYWTWIAKVEHIVWFSISRWLSKLYREIWNIYSFKTLSKNWNGIIVIGLKAE